MAADGLSPYKTSETTILNMKDRGISVFHKEIFSDDKS